MRVFWMIMAVLAVAVALLWYLRPPPARAPAPLPTAADGLTVLDQATVEASAAKVASAPVAEPAKITPKVEASVPAPKEKPAAPVTVAAKPAEAPHEEHDAIGPVTEQVLMPEPAAMRDPFTVIPVKGGASAAAGGAGVKPQTIAVKPDAQPAPSGASVKLEPQADGSTLVDGKYVIKGEGTKANPYRVTWEMLLTSEETYRPRLGKKVIPERVKMLDGKWIKISGYIAFPIMATSGDEMLMMLNQWDGCCIGVPPTPYDAIEVKLKAAAKGNDRLRTSGTLTGKFRVDPYLVKDWLISLYVMDDGELSDLKGEAQAPGVHAGNGP